MVNTKLNLSMKEPYVRQIYAKQGDTGRVLEIGLEDATLENGTLRILRPDGVEKTSDAVSSDSPTITDGMASFESLDEAEVTSLKVGISPVQDLHGYANPWVGGAGTNIIGDFGLEATKTGSGVTATRQEDGSTYALSGTATADVDIYILPNSNSRATDVGNYVVYAPTGTGLFGTSNYLIVSVYTESTSATRYIGVGGSANYNTFSIASGEHIRAIYIKVANGTNTNGKIVTPMIVKGSTAPTSYSPYTNICPIYAGNGKNLLQNTASSSSPSGITFTVNADGTVTATGTATADAQLQIPFSGLSGDYYFCGCPSDGNASTKYDVYAWDITVGARFKKWNGTTNSASDVGTYSLQEIQIPSGHSGYIVIRIKSGYAIQGSLLFKPMICRPTETDNSFVPYQGISLYQVGKNLCPTFTSVTDSGLTYTVNEDGSVHVTGTCTGTAFWAVQLTLPKGTYVLSGAPTNGQLTLRNARGGGAPSSAFSGSLDDYGNGATFTVSETASAWLNIRSTAGTHDKMYYPMIRLASETDDTYQPYLSHTYPISLGQSVYGGTLDVVGGKLTITHGFVPDMKQLTWQRSPSFPDVFYATISDAKGGVSGNIQCLCSCYKAVTSKAFMYLSGNQGEIMIQQSYATVGLCNSNYADVTACKNALENQQLVYELATPLEVDLTPTQITTLIGTNNMWADGEISELTFDYGKLLSVLTADQTEVVGRCLGDVEFNGASTMPFALIVKPNNKENA